MQHHGNRHRDGRTSFGRRVLPAGRRISVVHISVLAIALAMAFTVLLTTEAGRDLETRLSLEALYKQRGALPPPAQVAVVNLDRSVTGAALSQPDARRQSRQDLSRLIDSLSQRGASLIVLDLILEQPTSPDVDERLAKAIGDSGRTVLFKRLERTAEGDMFVEPRAPFQAAARGTGVFPLPKTRSGVNHYWPFFRTLEMNDDGSYSVREVPSLPVVALQLSVLASTEREAFFGIVNSLQNPSPAQFMQGNVTDAMVQLRQTLRQRENLIEPGLIASDSLQALLDFYVSNEMPQLNYYGPARTIDTSAASDLVNAGSDPGPGTDPKADPAAAWAADPVKGRVVFVGQSGMAAVDQLDGFSTVFTDARGVDLSGVEIAATGLANAMNNMALSAAPLLWVLLGYGVLGFLILLIITRCGVWISAVSTVALWFGCGLVAQLLFSHQQWLVPVGTLQYGLIPVLAFLGLGIRFVVDARQQARFHRDAGVLLPSQALRSLEAGELDRGSLEQTYVTCLITDIQGYTRMSETIPLGQLADMTQAYFSVLGDVVERHSGEMVDIIGDSMTAIWMATDHVSNSECGERACAAALDIAQQLQGFARQNPATPFHTRCALNAGWVSAGHMGGEGARRFRLVGDILNATSRLEGLNKLLGTQILATDPVLEKGAGVLTRSMGQFLLAGKKAPVEAFEVRCLSNEASVTDTALCERFTDAMHCLQYSQRADARQRLLTLSRDYPFDQASRFYLGLLGVASVQHEQRNATLNANGTVSLHHK